MMRQPFSIQSILCFTHLCLALGFLGTESTCATSTCVTSTCVTSTCVTSSCVTDRSFEKLVSSIKTISQQHEGEVSVAIEFVNSGKKILIQENQVMQTASLIKIAVMVEAYRQVEKGQLKLSQRLKLEQTDKVPGSGILTAHFDPGLELTLRDAIHLMIAYSDNTATNLVIDQVGLKQVCATMKKLGYPNTLINSKVYRGSTTSISKERSQLYGLGSTTAAETLRLLKSIHERKVVSSTASAAMLKHLAACDDDTKLARGLPPGTRIAHKSGAISKARCDAGIIETSSGPIVVVVLTQNNRDRSWGNNKASFLCGAIARLAFDYANRNQEKAASPIVLKEGSFGRRVEDLQRTLNARLQPSPGLSIDGDFGPATLAAVLKFQKKFQLKRDGIVDQDDWNQLSPIITTAQEVLPPTKINQVQLDKRPADSLDGVPFVTAKAWAIADITNGRILFHQNKDKRLDIASTTKIMTAFLVLEMSEKKPDLLNEKITFSKRADETRGSTSGIRAGEILSVKELLFGLLLPSGNDASVALAEHFGRRALAGLGIKPDKETSDYDAFIKAMNERARKLGMANTKFANPHGLTAENHQATASDLITLARAAMKLKSFRDYVSTRQHGCTVSSVSGYKRNLVWKNTNQLLEIENYLGVKTGTTRAAGACLVSAGKRGKRQLLMVVLGSGSSRGRYADSRNLYRWAWNQLESK